MSILNGLKKVFTRISEETCQVMGGLVVGPLLILTGVGAIVMGAHVLFPTAMSFSLPVLGTISMSMGTVGGIATGVCIFCCCCPVISGQFANYFGNFGKAVDKWRLLSKDNNASIIVVNNTTTVQAKNTATTQCTLQVEIDKSGNVVNITSANPKDLFEIKSQLLTFLTASLKTKPSKTTHAGDEKEEEQVAIHIPLADSELPRYHPPLFNSRTPTSTNITSETRKDVAPTQSQSLAALSY